MAGEGIDPGSKRGQRFGRYEIVALIASGGMGAVYKAFDPKKKRIVALKVMSNELAKKANMVARFRREAMTAAKLVDHEHIVTLREFGDVNGDFFIELEYVDGKDLHEHIAKSPGSRLPPEEARQIALQAAHALDHFHKAGIVHRDIKPSNFLVVKRPEGPLVKLTDLGLARFEDDDDHRVTKAGTTLGTVDYMSPEQARDSGKADIRSDIYSLGCTLYHMLAGRPPFNKGSMAERIVQHIEAEPPDICKVNEAVPKALGAIMRKMLAKKPRDRYQTPVELVADLEDPERAQQSAQQPKEAPAPEKKARKPAERTMGNEKEAPRPSTVDQPARKKSRRSRNKSATWVPFAIIGGIAAVVAVILLIVFSNRGGAPQEKKQEEARLPEKRVEPPKPTFAKQVFGPVAPDLKPLYKPVLPLDLEALRSEFHGPFTAWPVAPADAKVVIVRRAPLAATASVGSLAEAFAQAPAQGTLVIEIQDQGPHFLSSLPARSDHSLWIRGGPGVRPMLAWDGAGASNLVTLARGSLILENLDIVVHGPEKQEPACLFHVQGGDFKARDCTFSVAGKHSQGVIVARLQGARPAAAASLVTLQATPPLEGKARFTRCFARGQDLVLLGTDNTPADILIEETLAAGGTQPLLWHRNREDDGLNVRLIRSTLTAQRELWRWQSSTGKGASPRLRAFIWDTLLARADAPAAEGDLLHLADEARTNLMGFKIVNCLYTGWRNLLVSSDKVCSTLESWRDLWGHREGDLAQLEPWPRGASALDDVPAAHFTPYESSVAFAGTSGPPALGCELGRLPPEPPHWKERTFERWTPIVVDLPETDMPEIPTGPEGRYHGEKIELGNLDLGSHVQARLQTMTPGPRIVLHLSGKGVHGTTPLRFKGVEQVVICFEPSTPGAKDPLTLEPRAGAAAGGLIDVEGGSLEIQHGRFRFDNSRIAALPPHLLRVRGGDLRLLRCTLVGPLSKAPDSFQSLIACDGAGAGAPRPALVALRECALMSGKPILELKGPSVRLRSRGCLLYSLSDVVTVDLGTLETSRPDFIALLEHNTVAWRQAFVHLRSFEAPTSVQPVVLQTHANYFVDPSPGEPRQSSLVRLSAESLGRGLLHWQGKGNVFARDRMQAYYTIGDGAAAKQTIEDWERLLGPVGETDATQVDSLATKTFNVDQPAFERLALPSTLRRDPRPGADLVALGLIKKK